MLLFIIAKSMVNAKAVASLLARTTKHENDLLRSILGNFPVPYLLVDANEKVLQTNQSCLDMIEIDGPLENCYGKSLAEIYYNDPTRETLVGKSIREGKIYQDIEVSTMGYRGKKLNVLANISPLYDVNNICIGGLCIYIDHSERRMLEAQLAQAGRMEAIGQLAAGIAHEINTPTQYVSDSITFLRDAFGDIGKVMSLSEEVAREHERAGRELSKVLKDVLAEIDYDFLKNEIPRTFDRIFDGIGRISSIVQAMKRFSYTSGHEFRPVNIQEAISNTLVISKNEWKYIATVETEFDPGLTVIMCLPGEINQVLLNIIVNAAHAIGDVVRGTSNMGSITIKTIQAGDYAEISIQDTGFGIPEDVRDKVFNLFFTTKEVGKGTGQGLAIAYDIVVNKHHGSITFKSEMGRGTTFFIRLPLEGLYQQQSVEV